MTAPVRQVLSAAAGVLQQLEGRCVGLQDALSPVVAAGPPGAMDAARPMALQDLDYVTQGLASLSYFLAALAERVPAELTVDAAAAASGLPLEDMAAVLSLSPPPAAAAGGELELFE